MDPTILPSWALGSSQAWRNKRIWDDLCAPAGSCSAQDSAMGLCYCTQCTQNRHSDEQWSTQGQLVRCLHPDGCKLSSYHTAFKHQGFFLQVAFLFMSSGHHAAGPFLLKGQGTEFVSRIWFLHALGLIHLSLPLASASRNFCCELLWWEIHPTPRSVEVWASLVLKEGRSQLAQQTL